MSGSTKNPDQLSPKQRALYELLLKEKKDQLQASATQSQERTIPQRQDTGPALASFSQQRLWVVDQLEGGRNFAYNVHITVQFTGVLDIPLLERCVNGVVRRHESLRTVFATRDDGMPVQVVLPELRLGIPVEDLSHLPRQEQDAEVERRTSEESQRTFDLTRGPLLRGRVLRLGPDNHIALVTMHHLVTDRWSLGVFVRELMALYAAEVTGQAAELPELAIQYSDFAEWQRERMQGERLRTELDFWKQHLRTLPSPLELPTDRPRPPEQTYRGSRQFVTLPVALTRALKDVSQQEGATLFMTLLSVFQTLLHRHSGQTDVTVGSPIAGRNVPEVEALIGFFVNTLILRNDLDGNPTFRELLRRAKAVCMAAYAHQELPFEKLVEELQPPRDLSRHPLFQVMFSFQNTPRQDLSMPGLQSTYLLVDPGSAKFDLLLELREDRPDEIFGWLEYNTDLFDTTTIQRMRGHFYTLLGAVAANPDQRLSELPLLTAEEERQLLADFRGSDEAYPRDVCLHSLIEAQVERTPDAEAVRFEGEALTYAQLDARANQLAHHLRSLGAGPESLVGVCLERSLEMVVALLGVLKSGAAYVPLDPSYPRERLTWMLEDTAAPVLLLQEHLRGVLPPHSSQVLCLDSEWATVARQPTTRPAPLAGPESLAYVIFTSGSTGRPKGAMNAHSGVVNRLLWMQQQYRLTPADTVLQKTPFSFDVSVWEFFWPLLTGARMVVARPGGHQEPTYLVQLMAGERVTTAHFVPSMLRAFVEEPGLEGLTGLRRVVCSGEALPAELVRRAHARLPAAEVHNLYGPTETAVDVTWWECPRGDARHSVPIGRPVANTRIHILDAHGQPTPVGVSGELFIGGIQVGRGYWNRPQLTAERFIPDAFSGTPGARLYRTGDLARWLPDGTVEYLGRADFQVKLRGFRIELGEVEAALRAHPRVADTVVVVREDGPQGPSLVAYLVSASAGLDTQELRAALAGRLPEFMVPSAFVVLEALPLSPNGKVDRKALPAPEPRESSREYVAPRTPTEELLAGLFAQVLGLERVGATDSFFELGGHSLLGTRLVARLRSIAGVELSLRALFEAPTVAALAERVESTRSGVRAPPLLPVPRAGDLSLSFAQQRLWFLDGLRPGSPVFNMPIALRLDGPVDLSAMGRGLTELVRRHEVLRTTYGDGPVAVIHPPGSVPLPVVDLSSLPEDEREAEAGRLAREEAQRPFDLTRGPMLRASVVRLSGTRHLLLLTLHHIAADGWSLDVLVRESAALYAAFSAGQPSPLSELSVQYADYAAWQRGWLQGEALEAQRSWWREHLAGAPPLLELPTDFPRPATQGFHGAMLSGLLLPRPLAGALLALSRREGTTLFMALLAGFEVMLSRYSGQEDFVVGTDIANRDHSETEGLIGFFINQLALRARLDGNPSFRELLARVRTATLGAYAHQDLPFEEVVRALNPDRNPGHAPLVQVKLVLQNQPASELTLPGLTLRPQHTDSGTSRLDVTFSVTETAQGLECSCEYRTDLFEAETIGRMVRHLGTVLEAAVARPEAPLSTLPLMTEAEQRQVLVEWNATARDFPRDACAHQLFEAQAARTPQATAVRFEGVELTYAQLDARANQLAWHLRSLGVRPEVPVALCVERSLDMVVGILGILKAGGAWVPMDPSYPVERLTYMLRDCAAPVLVTTEAIADELPSGSERLLLLDAEAPLIQAQPTTAVEGGAGAGNLAYVIYTSGSTGWPKGTLLQHRGLCNTALTAAREHGFHPGSRVLQYAAFGFDASVAEILGTLLAGATLVLAPRERLMPDAPLRTLLREESITAVTLTPSVLAQLTPEDSWALETLISAGEACTPELVERWGGRVRLLNAYGPTEVTVCATLSEPMRPGQQLTIGRPWANVRVYVLDASGQPVPVGVPGELCVDSVGLARGYLGRPELTAERFVPHPFSTQPGARLYRTGDRVRWLTDGTLEYLGRLDTQLKLRGLRIEPGEVEAALRRHPAVREAAVLAREGLALVAYLVPNPGAVLETAAARAFLRQTLPEYMVPSAFVMLEALPLTSSGKLDRKALPAPTTSRAGEVMAPRTDTERQLAALWSGLLGVKDVSLRDDFFELGGHSLLATQLQSRIRVSFGVELSLQVLFEAPTLEAQAGRVDALAVGALPLQAPPLRPRPRQERLPLSFAQQRLWFLEQLEPGLPTFNMPSSLRLEGPLDVRALEQAFQEVVRRHESLRTFFVDGPEGPAQVVIPEVELPLARVDLRVLPPGRREEEARRLEAEETRRPFDLSRGPLLRAMLVSLRDEEHLLLLTMHHIASDGWSMGVLVHDVVALYAAFREGRPSPLPELAVQYGDYAAWQRQWMQGEVLEAQLGYWRQQLEGAPTVLELPADRPRPAVRTYRGASHPVFLSPELTGQLEALARREGATLFMVLMAAFQSLLHRYSGQTDLVVGTDVANRNRAETEGLIGFFINQLVLRLRLDGNPSFRDVLEQTKAAALGAYAHQDLPFEEVVRALNPERSLSHAPLFQVKFVLQNTPQAAPELPGLTLTVPPREQEAAASKQDLTVLVGPASGGLECAWMYSTDLFDPATVERMARHFQHVLEAVVAQEGRQRLSELPLLTEEERRRVLGPWSGADAPYPRRCVHELISEQAARTPDATAVVAGDERLTYAELERRANQLAHWLKALGVEPEMRVALFVERRAHALVGLLGILKAGGAYVPLDPSYAHMSERVRHVLKDARVQVIVTEESLASELPSQGEFLVSLDAEDGLLESQPEEAPDSRAVPGNAAYIIYTSGSTGQPKGVCIEHGQLACYVAGVSQRLELPAGMSFASVSTLAADLGHTALFPTLCAGGAVHLVGKATAADAALLASYGRRHAVEGLKIVPTHLEALLADADAREVLPRRRLVLGGDRAEWALVERVHALAPECEVFNHYGPTETTVGVLAQRVERGGRVPGAQSVPLGRPLGNVRVYVLDGYGRPVPPRVPGELYVGGQSVGRGYLGRPDLTAERFLPDAFRGEPGARMYRTGDRVRWLEDGSIEFLGRVDHQLKIRGYRVELGEVEAVLAGHPAVAECVVVAWEDVPGLRQLVAYAVGRSGKALEEPALREYLAERLPDYMVPSACVVLEALPLTSNGKVDRKALPAPSRNRAVAEYVEPRTETEQRLAALWKELLNVSEVGARDDFFELGGHSLLATQVVARVRPLFDVQLAVIDLFEAPTLEALAARIEAGATSDSPLVTLRKGGGAKPFFCVHPVGGGVLAYLELAKRMESEQPFYGLQVPRGGSGETVEEMAAHYLEAVRGVQPEGPYLLGGWSMGGRVAYEMARQLKARGEEVGLLVIVDARGREDAPTEAQEAEGVLEFALHLSRLAGLHPGAAEVLEQVDAVELGAVLDGQPVAGLDEESCTELRALWAMFSRNRRASRQYVPEPFSGSLVLLRAAEQPEGQHEKDLGWSALARGGVETYEVAGDHFSLMALPHVEQLAARLRTLLERARTGGSLQRAG
ncbi:non-ribosomal peptide synthetase [Pyxidicoccus xibeiensis]|uniref:non-ribosomal peptide synthetase n=1 Tax=Pyxidicoccus xibeiensis TaxID=2906759 RepID=UPI0020A7A800|nr:non-ribosomal peptide synthetase [Pyxidicoccus xibeiensis]MCP3140550.1 amino acid adenylation domain-containing protein [Pyxidicoccus xibeiensis]